MIFILLIKHVSAWRLDLGPWVAWFRDLLLASAWLSIRLWPKIIILTALVATYIYNFTERKTLESATYSVINSAWKFVDLLLLGMPSIVGKSEKKNRRHCWRREKYLSPGLHFFFSILDFEEVLKCSVCTNWRQSINNASFYTKTRFNVKISLKTSVAACRQFRQNAHQTIALSG